MIQITFTPETPQQVAALTQAMMAYIKATPQASLAAQELVEHPDLPVVVAAGMDAEAPKAVVRKLKKPDTPAVEAPVVTLEQVRAKLTELSQGGKAADVKSLIAKFGGTKLTDLKADQYADVLAAAEAL